MAYYRFEAMEQISPNPHLSSGTGAIIKGTYLTLRNNTKKAGTGSQLHYHPNELIVFSLGGRLNCVVGKNRRIVLPGTCVHMPPLARHSIMATEDGGVSYLYCKDNTWDMTGFAAEEELSDAAKQAGNGSQADAARIEGLDECYYNVIDGLDAPYASADHECTIAGERVICTYHESRTAGSEQHASMPHERFIYVICGRLVSDVDGEHKQLGPRDVAHAARGGEVVLTLDGTPTRWVTFEPTPLLEAAIDRQ